MIILDYSHSTDYVLNAVYLTHFNVDIGPIAVVCENLRSVKEFKNI